MNDPDPSLLPDVKIAAKTMVMHATTVAFGGAAVLITGPSGAGKSALALQLMALGAVLVSDDKTCLQDADDGLWARAPASIKGMIEARGVGILAASTCEAAIVRLIVDLAHEEVERLPVQRHQIVLGQTLPVLHNVKAAHFAAAILQYLKGGRTA